MDRAIASGAIGREFESLRAHQILPRFLLGLRSFAKNLAQDFGCGLPLRSRPQNASSSNLSGRTILPRFLLGLRSFAKNLAQDFGCGLPLRSRPQNASSSNLSGRTKFFVLAVSAETWLIVLNPTSCLASRKSSWRNSERLPSPPQIKRTREHEGH